MSNYDLLTFEETIDFYWKNCAIFRSAYIENKLRREFASEVAARMKDRGITVSQMARETKASQSMVRRFLRGDFTFSTLIRMIGGLGLDISHFEINVISGDGEPSIFISCSEYVK